VPFSLHIRWQAGTEERGCTVTHAEDESACNVRIGLKQKRKRENTIEKKKTYKHNDYSKIMIIT
jgi:hypothetical protein